MRAGIQGAPSRSQDGGAGRKMAPPRPGKPNGIKERKRNRIKLDLHTTASAVGTSDVQMGKLSNQRKQKPGRRREKRGRERMPAHDIAR